MSRPFVALMTAAACLCATAAVAQTADPGPHDPARAVYAKPTLTAAAAWRMIDTVVAEAARRREGVSIAIVDEGGNLLAFERMDNTSLGTIDAATLKAVSALRLERSTSSLMEGLDINTMVGFSSAGFTVLGGAKPIVLNGAVVGAIGVSGASGDDPYVDIGLKAFP